MIEIAMRFGVRKMSSFRTPVQANMVSKRNCPQEVCPASSALNTQTSKNQLSGLGQVYHFGDTFCQVSTSSRHAQAQEAAKNYARRLIQYLYDVCNEGLICKNCIRSRQIHLVLHRWQCITMLSREPRALPACGLRSMECHW